MFEATQLLANLWSVQASCVSFKKPLCKLYSTATHIF